MKAARFYGKEDVRIEEVPEPSPGPGQVKLRNAFAGISGSDLHFYFFPESLPFDLDHRIPSQVPCCRRYSATSSPAPSSRSATV
ncbi:hypothetical protein [Streptomyces sp. NPDC057682]|uniref:hypothetical protein n=1 Tax=Streptomyces sp. NPDC057682 TaxID=3346210 RepID=UPI0036994EAD